jgi:U3 small nucleolar RNA-associated protein 22
MNVQSLNFLSQKLIKCLFCNFKIDELVSEVKYDQKKAAPLEATLHKLRSIIDEMKSIPEMTLTEAVQKMDKLNVKIPFPDPQPTQDKINYKFAFQKPTKIHIVGSYLLKSVTKSPEGLTNVDIAVEMPSVSLISCL